MPVLGALPTMALSGAVVQACNSPDTCLFSLVFSVLRCVLGGCL